MLCEFHRFETDVTAPDGSAVHWHVQYVPDEEELRAALTLADHRRFGMLKTALQSGIAALVGVVCLVNFFTDPARPSRTLTIGVLCFVLAAIALLYAPLSARAISRREAAAKREVNIWISDRGIGFGKTAEHYTVLAFSSLTVLAAEGLLALIPGKNSLIALPLCAVNDECRAFLAAHLPFDGKEEN